MTISLCLNSELVVVNKYRNSRAVWSERSCSCIIVISPPNSTTYLPNLASTDEQDSPDSFPSLKPVILTPQLKFHQPEAYNPSQTTVMWINTSFHLPIPFQPMVALYFRAPISLNPAPRPPIQSIATKIAKIIFLPYRQQLSDHGSIPHFATAWNQIWTHENLSFGTTNEKNWLFRIHLCHPSD